jgi:hypothetical protein
VGQIIEQQRSTVGGTRNSRGYRQETSSPLCTRYFRIDDGSGQTTERLDTPQVLLRSGICAI